MNKCSSGISVVLYQDKTCSVTLKLQPHYRGIYEQDRPEFDFTFLIEILDAHLSMQRVGHMKRAERRSILPRHSNRLSQPALSIIITPSTFILRISTPSARQSQAVFLICH